MSPPPTKSSPSSHQTSDLQTKGRVTDEEIQKNTKCRQDQIKVSLRRIVETFSKTIVENPSISLTFWKRGRIPGMANA